jgi:NAD(P)H-hydrate epimerase
MIESAPSPLVIDADAINALAGHLEILERLTCGAVLTPHAGEMARLLGIAAESVQAGRLELARAFAVKWQVAVVLKGHRTVVALPGGDAFINPTGNPGMATAGAGDVLTGVVAAFIGAGLSAQSAAVAAAYLHGRAGDIAAARLGEASVRASDIAACLPDALQEL